MKTMLIAAATTLVAVFFYLGLVVSALAQANIRESAPIGAGNSPDVVRSGQAVSEPAAVSSNVTTPLENTVVSDNLAYQIQQLQQELLELRGLLEEQGFELRRLKQQRLDDYLDLDKRLSELSQQAQPQNKKAPLFGSKNQSDALVPQVSDKDLYRKAMDQLLNQQDYPGAQALFGQYLTQFPEGDYIPNVHYWQGQIYLAENNKPAAAKSFKILLDNYPGHQKTFDAKYKMATIYFDQGKKTEAKALLDEVAASESDSSRLAKAFLANQYN